MTHRNGYVIEEHLDLVAAGGNRGSHFSWTVYNGSGHAMARSVEPFRTAQEARVDVAFALLMFKTGQFAELEEKLAGGGA